MFFFAKMADQVAITKNFLKLQSALVRESRMVFASWRTGALRGANGWILVLGGIRSPLGFLAVREGLFKNFPKTIAYTYIYICIHIWHVLRWIGRRGIPFGWKAYFPVRAVGCRERTIYNNVYIYICMLFCFVVFDGTFMWHCSRS